MFHFLGKYNGSVVLQQQWKDMTEEISVFYLFFQNSLVFVLDKILHKRHHT